jgi:hypothetical protein
MQARFALRDGKVLTLTGFFTVNRERLRALSADQLAELMRQDDLELIYLHLQSMRHLSATAERIGAGASDGKSEEQEPQTAPEPTGA